MDLVKNGVECRFRLICIDAVVAAAFETYVNVTFSQFVILGKVGEKVVDNFRSWLMEEVMRGTG